MPLANFVRLLDVQRSTPLNVSLCAMNFLRAGWPSVVGPGIRIMLVAFGVGAVWTFLDRMSAREHADARRALDQRVVELSAGALAPGSPLGCLESNLGETLQVFCEKAIFAGPDTVAAATAYVTGSLALLADGLANGLDSDYHAALGALRHRLEFDRFGFVAQVLAGQGCSAAKCEKFALFADARRVGANLTAHTFEAILARHSVEWPQRGSPSASATPAAPVAVAPGLPRPTGTVGINFPSAASIPPVSIMTDEPNEPASRVGGAPAQPAQKR
jgi:hypothetical protein